MSRLSLVATLTRDVALALKDSTARATAVHTMRVSRVRESKVQLTRYLRAREGGEVLAAATRRSGQTATAILAALDSLPDLEFYMPVPAHRKVWNGGEDLVVAGALDDSTLVGYDLQGNPVALSTKSPPAVPTLVIVPVETDFTQVSYDGAPMATANVLPACPPDAPPDDPCNGEGSGGGGMPAQPPGIYMNEMVIRDAHEPWFRGAPELDVIFWAYMQGGYRQVGTTTDGRPIIGYDPNLLTRQFAGCAGERATDWRNFNFDSNGSNIPIWNTVLLAETREFAGIESVYDATQNIVLHERRVPLSGPYEFEIMERDDGYQCPAPPRYYSLSGSLHVIYQTDRFHVSVNGFGFSDLMALLGNNNDRVALFSFTSTAALEALNGSLSVGTDADIRFTNRGFHAADIPPAQDPYVP